jgi:hypothetical protein
MNLLIIFQQILLELYPLLYTLGILGNILSFLTLSRKKFKNTIFETYFRVINITDSITLIFIIYEYLLKKNIDVNKFHWIICYYLDYILYLIPPISSWSLVLISLDRMMNTIYPNVLASIRNSKKYQYGLCLTITIINIIYYLPDRIYKSYELNQTVAY